MPSVAGCTTYGCTAKYHAKCVGEKPGALAKDDTWQCFTCRPATPATDIAASVAKQRRSRAAGADAGGKKKKRKSRANGATAGGATAAAAIDVDLALSSPCAKSRACSRFGNHSGRCNLRRDEDEGAAAGAGAGTVVRDGIL